MTGPETKKMALKQDPRFLRPKKKDTKLKVDSRFKGMFESDEFVAPVKVDKYGRKIVDTTPREDLKRFYDLEEDQKGIESESEHLSFDEEENVSSSSSEDSELSEEEPEMLVFEETLSQHPLVNREVELGEATNRLALVNIDWDQIKAVDIMQMLQAFKPVTGVIESVKVYPSEFGRERMALEAIQGPPKDIFKNSSDTSSQSGSEFEEENNIESMKPVMVDENEDFNEAQLRKYQLERLRYYYAVITCDSRETSAAIYKQCDGAEFEMSANFLDLRYIPDSVSFDLDEPTDVAVRPNKNYKPKTDVITPALQHSKVKLTWDMDDPDRARFTKVNFANFDYKENDLKAYLASSSEDDGEEDREDEAAKYRELLLKGSGNVFGRKSHDDNDELQVTFTTGFDGISSDSDGDNDVHMEATFDASEGEEEAKNEDETVFEARLRKMREKRKAKKEIRLTKIAEHKATEKAERLAAKQQSKKKRRLNSNGNDDKQAAELDLLMLDDAPDAMAGRHFDMSEIIKKEKKLKKGPRTAKNVHVDDFKLDVEDDRFKAIYEEPSYSIDPTHASFKKTSAMRSLIDERQRRLKFHHN